MNWIDSRIQQAEAGATKLDLSVEWIYRPDVASKDVLTEIPPRILEIKHLRELDLGGHNITRIPPGFHKLENLTRLSLAGNREVQFDENSRLPTQLTHLDLSGAGTGEFDFARLPNLRTLSLSRSRVSFPFSGLCSLGELEEIDLAGVPLASLSGLRNLLHLRELTIDNDSAPGASAAEELAYMHSLQRLSLSSIDSALLWDTIPNLAQLQALSLTMCKLEQIPARWNRLTKLSEFVFWGLGNTRVPGNLPEFLSALPLRELKLTN